MTFIRRILADSRATGAMEFGLTFPVIIFLVLGAVDIGTFLVNMERARRSAVTASDLTSQWTPAQSVSNNGGVGPGGLGPNAVQQILSGAVNVAPVAAGNNFGLILTLVSADNSDNVTITGQVASASVPSGFTSMLGSVQGQQPSLYAPGSPPTVAGVPLAANDQAIFVEVRYTFQPFIFAQSFNYGVLSVTPGFFTTNDFAVFRARQPITWCDSTTTPKCTGT